MSYATQTTVSVERSRAEIEQLLLAKGASQIMSAFDVAQGRAIFGFTMNGRMVRLAIPLPDRESKDFTHKRYNDRFTWRTHTAAKQQALWEQACRSRWRAIVLILKAKFEAIEAGISTLEREFLADTVMADGSTVGQWMQPQLETMYSSGRMPALLPAGGDR